MEYWINIFTNATEPISCLAEDPRLTQQAAVEGANEYSIHLGWSYLHTIHSINGIAHIIDLAPMVAEDEENTRLDREQEEREIAVIRDQQNYKGRI